MPHTFPFHRLTTLVLSLSLALPLSVWGKPAVPPQHSPEVEGKALDRAYLDMLIAVYNSQVHRGSDLKKIFLKNLKAKDRAGIYPLLSSITKTPHLTRIDDTLTFQFEGGKVEVRWPDLREPQFIVENVHVVIDRTAPLRWQYELFEKKMKDALKNPPKSALWNFLVPEATAAVASALFNTEVRKTMWLTLLGIVTAESWSTIENATCWSLFHFNFHPQLMNQCSGYKKQVDDYVKTASAIPDKERDRKVDWDDPSPTCVEVSAGKPGTYQAWLDRAEKAADGTWKYDNAWFRLEASFDKDNNLLSANILSAEQKWSDPDADNLATVVFTFAPLLDTIKFRKLPLVNGISDEERLLAYDPKNPTDTKYVPISALDTPDKIPAVYRDRVKRMKTLIDAVPLLYATCLRENRKKEHLRPEDGPAKTGATKE